ncbi:MAG: phage major capsid protein, partial [Clostridium sp.]|uniref:phage major capsid protein n=1 Tax=Clostridium sp. TaxID=1506 RepID=UPI003F31D43E
MPIKNLDNNISMDQMRAQVNDALQGENKEAISEALVRMAQGIHDNILKEAQQEARSLISSEVNDRNVLNKRGINALTSEERKYYGEVIEKRGFTNLTVTLPTTIFDRVFEDLEQSHPLLSEITFQNTTAVTEWIIRKTNCEAAWWGTLTDSVKKELQHGFDKVKTDMYKLSAFMPVSKAMLDLGPEWLDRYVRTVLSEAMALALES